MNIHLLHVAAVGNTSSGTCFGKRLLSTQQFPLPSASTAVLDDARLKRVLNFVHRTCPHINIRVFCSYEGCGKTCSFGKMAIRGSTMENRLSGVVRLTTSPFQRVRRLWRSRNFGLQELWSVLCI